MIKLIKPDKPIDAFSDEIVKAFCEHDGCSPNCQIDESGTRRCRSRNCTRVDGYELEEDILF